MLRTALKAQGNYIQCDMLVYSNMLHFVHLHKHANTTCMKAQGNIECMHGMLVSFTYQIFFTCLGHTTCDEYCWRNVEETVTEIVPYPIVGNA